MRVIYENLIDDLVASTMTALTTASGYSILDVQDQRLAVKYKTDSASTQSVLCTFNTIPDRPDGTALYSSNFATTDGWTLFGAGGTWTVSGGIGALERTAASTVYINRAAMLFVAGMMIRLKMRRVSGSGNVRVKDDSVGGVAIKTITDALLPVATSWSYFDIATVSTTSTLMEILLDGITKIEFEFVYAGTGQYATLLSDNSGNGYTGTMYGIRTIAGAIGNALVFNGYTSKVTTNLNFPTSAFTLSFWAKTSTDGRQILGSYGAPGNKQMLVAVGALSVGNKLNLNLYSDGTTAISFAGASNIQDGTWKHHAIVFTPGVSVAFYLNGALDALRTTSVPATLFDSTALFTLGYSSNYFDGSLDDIRIYNRALSDLEVLNLYNRLDFVGIDSGLLAFYKPDYGLEINTIAILGHNISASCNVKIQATNYATWPTTPELDEVITHSPDIMLKFLSSTYIYKYWKFSFTGLGDIEIGRLWLGTYMTIDPSSELNFKIAKKRSDNVIHGKNRQKFATIGNAWRLFSFDFPASEEAMLYKMNKLYDTVGNHSSFIFCNFDTLRDYLLVEPCYVSINGDLGFRHESRMDMSYSLEMEEEQ